MRIFALCNTDLIYTLPLGFKQAGHEVQKSGTILEDKLKSQIEKFKPDLIIDLGWTTNHYREKWAIIKNAVKASGVPYIYWSIEDSAFTEEFCLPFIQAVQPDFVFSICPETVEDYKRMGIKATYMNFGYNGLIHYPITPQEEYKYSIAIVANVYPGAIIGNEKYKRYEAIRTLIIPLLKENIRVDFWGRDWDVIANLEGCYIPKEWMHENLSYRDTNKVYNSSNIIIGLQNSDTELTQRTYEILAAGGFLLTNNTSRIRSLFKVDEQLVASSSPEETVKLVKYYMNHPDERRRIAVRALGAVGGNSYKERAEYVIDVLRREEILKK